MADTVTGETEIIATERVVTEPDFYDKAISSLTGGNITKIPDFLKNAFGSVASFVVNYVKENGVNAGIVGLTGLGALALGSTLGMSWMVAAGLSVATAYGANYLLNGTKSAPSPV